MAFPTNLKEISHARTDRPNTTQHLTRHLFDTPTVHNNAMPAGFGPTSSWILPQPPASGLWITGSSPVMTWKSNDERRKRIRTHRVCSHLKRWWMKREAAAGTLGPGKSEHTTHRGCSHLKRWWMKRETAASTLGPGKSEHTKCVAGAAGFEPAITGPKPAALPLGYAPAEAL